MSWFSILFGDSNTPSTTVVENAAHPTLLETAPAYLFNSTESLLGHIAAIPRAIRDLTAQDSARAVTRSVLTTMKDIAPLLMVNCATSLLRNSLDAQAPLLSIDGSLIVALELIDLGVNIYATRSWIRGKIATVCAPAAFSLKDAAPYKSPELCKEECNGALVLLNGAINETAAYYSNLGAVWALAKIPYVGYPLSQIISTYASGRYIAGLTSTRCQEHEFLKSETTLSLGIIHKSLEYLVWKTFASSLGIQSPILMRILNDLPLLLTISIATHDSKRPIVTKETRTLRDPLEIYENMSGFVLEGVCAGSTVQIKKLLSGPPSTIPWKKIADHALSIIQHPYIRNTGTFFLPKMLHSWDYFINEPMISPRWTAIQQQLIYITKTLEESSQYKMVEYATKMQHIAVLLLSKFLRLPKPIVKILLQIMGDQYYMDKINQLRCWLELHQVKKDTGLVLIQETIPMRTSTVREANPIAAIMINDSPDQDPIKMLTGQSSKTQTAAEIHQFFKPSKKPVAVNNVDKYMVRSYGK